jgi:hypothetical protein
MSTAFPARLEARLYLLRALVHLKVLRLVFQRRRGCDELLNFLDIDSDRLDEPSEFKGLRAELRIRHEKLEARWQRRNLDDLDSVLSDLQFRVELSSTEKAALRLCVRLHQHSVFLDALDGLTPGAAGRSRLLSQVLK